jgi:hypothetical protein
VIDGLKKIVPFRLHRAAVGAVHRYSFPRVLNRIAALAPNTIPSRELLEALRVAWENESWSGRTKYLEAVVQWASLTPGPILECGTGLTTILLGLFAGQRGIPIWSLEHNVEWYERMNEVLRRYRVPEVEICFAPLQQYGSFSWYQPPLDRLPESFKLVICDGPPERTTSGGRYGLLPVMDSRLSSDAVILVDDVDPDAESTVVTRWLSERSAIRKFWRGEPLHSFALIVLD